MFERWSQRSETCHRLTHIPRWTALESACSPDTCLIATIRFEPPRAASRSIGETSSQGRGLLGPICGESWCRMSPRKRSNSPTAPPLYSNGLTLGDRYARSETRRSAHYLFVCVLPSDSTSRPTAYLIAMQLSRVIFVRRARPSGRQDSRSIVCPATVIAQRCRRRRLTGLRDMSLGCITRTQLASRRRRIGATVL